MERATTTEELLSALTPEARDEAVRLAARLQVESEESRTLLAAAREAGIEDRHLREAAERMRGQAPSVARTSLLAWPFEHPLPASLAFVFAFLQLLAISAVFQGYAPETLLILLGLSAILGLTFPRERAQRLAPAFVLGTGALVIVLHLLHIHWGNGLTLASAAEQAWRIVAAETLVAWLGAAVASAWSRRGRILATRRPSLSR